MKLWHFDDMRQELVFMDPQGDGTSKAHHFDVWDLAKAGWKIVGLGELPKTYRAKVTF